MRIPMHSAMIRLHPMPKRAPFFALSYFPAPRFWLIKVVRAMEKQVIGRKPKPSTLEYAPHPATARFPKLLILDWTTTLAREMIEF